MQGPPGTGKSQTITNIIATKLAEGKKVLFVSEKKTALEVVYKRLKDVGLSDFCLSLHNNKASKKETLAQLEDSLSLSRKKVVLSDSLELEQNKFENNRKKLNDYSRQVNKKIPPLNKSLFFANGMIIKNDFRKSWKNRKSNKQLICRGFRKYKLGRFGNLSKANYRFQRHKRLFIYKKNF